MSKTVLLVEDEFLIALDLTLVLERHGWIVIGPAATVTKALALLKIQRPSVALLDVTLRDGSVTPVAEALRANNVPFVIASAYETPEDVGGEVLAGAINVGKPTDAQDLLKTLEQVIQS
ncbi:response regulator (plasmid) [Ensifer adhaerens]|uniref:response regulator n=1 Tax=Ensifer adhaerens TaxID=106592 RepID=UPI0023A9E937|nr:response regulator [Ensifer adhaerens]WDZ81883.1 response regulator [Ensifer adhaerens]